MANPLISRRRLLTSIVAGAAVAAGTACGDKYYSCGRGVVGEELVTLDGDTRALVKNEDSQHIFGVERDGGDFKYDLKEANSNYCR